MDLLSPCRRIVVGVAGGGDSELGGLDTWWWAAGGGGHRPGKAPGGIEGGQAAKRQEPRRGEALES